MRQIEKSSSRFIESILLQNGTFPLITYHQRRIDEVFRTHFGGKAPLDLAKIPPQLSSDVKHKMRVVYDHKSHHITTEAYEMRMINSIRLIEGNQIDYSYKYENRDEINALYAKRGEADDILIVKGGLITDSYYANPVFWDGSGWYVPQSYLLNGVRRQALLASGKIKERIIRASDLKYFEKISLVNAMIDLGESEIPIKNIIGF